jgi:adenine-specific DNA-methyltransferase
VLPLFLSKKLWNCSNTIFFRKSTEYAFIGVFFQSILIVPHNTRKCCKWEVEVYGFDYYNTKTGNIESGNVEKIAVWMLDTDYDGRSIFPRQVFFPMAGEKDAWSRLARNLKAEIDEDLIESYQGTVSLPFEIGEYQRVAVKIVDDRGIESLKIIRLTP